MLDVQVIFAPLNSVGSVIFSLVAAGTVILEAITSHDQKDSTSISKEQMESLQAELDRTGVTMETVQGRYQIQEPQSMSRELYGRVMSALKRTKSTEAA